MEIDQLKKQVEEYKELKSKCEGRKQELEKQQEAITNKLTEQRVTTDTISSVISSLEKEIEQEVKSLDMLLKDLHAHFN